MKYASPLLAFCICATLATTLHAKTPLFDFETNSDVSGLKWSSKGQSELKRSPRFATSGSSSLLFTSPAWRKGMPEWPSFEVRPPITNWNGFDRLVIDITNPNEERYFFSLFVSDSKVPFRKGLSYQFDLPARGFKRFEVPLSSFPKEVNLADIAILHFFTQYPNTNLTLFLDNVVLLRPGESLAQPGTRFVQELKAFNANSVLVAEKSLARGRAEVSSFPGTSSSLVAQLSQLSELLKTLRAELASPSLTLERLNKINAELVALTGRIERVLSVIRLQKDCHDTGLPADNMLVGVATSMEKILPRDAPFELEPVREVEISLARNEKESFQVLVLPVSSALRKVSVSANDLKSDNGAIFKREQIQCEVVGYIETKAKPPYDASFIGWWPDPILDFLGPVEIAAGDLQAFWIRIRAPKDQPPGIYRGILTVAATDTAPMTLSLSLSVRVYSFTLPDHSPLPVAITFEPMHIPTEATEKDQSEWRKSEEYPLNAWNKHKLRWVDFLADYYINYDSLYRSGPPDFEVIQRLRDRGQLVSFNLGIFDAVSRPADAGNELSLLRTAYNKAKEMGALDQAYIYGFDECPEEKFPLLEKTAQTLRREFPGVLLLTTSTDYSYGQDTAVKTIDAWCPLTSSFNPDQAAKARAAGKKVWWYICCFPHHPYANMFVEYPAIEGRLLMGAMTAKQRPDGFLYYQISIWNSRRPITSGPFTDWNPRSWTTYHGDGSWTCVGPGGTPLPTVRLENFRDGLEDFAYVVILEDIIRQRKAEAASLTAKQQQWLSEAKAALLVPESLVKTMTEYSREPAKLYAWRNHIGDLIERSGVTDANPWGKNFGTKK